MGSFETTAAYFLTDLLGEAAQKSSSEIFFASPGVEVVSSVCSWADLTGRVLEEASGVASVFLVDLLDGVTAVVVEFSKAATDFFVDFLDDVTGASATLVTSSVDTT